MNVFLTTLLKILNNPEIKSSDYQIACTLVDLSSQISNLTIQELAEKCYVSVSTLKRFFNQYGFNKYSIFKTTFLTQIEVRKSQMRKRKQLKKYEDLQKVFQTLLSNDEYEKIITNDKIYNIIDKINESKRIILIGSDEMIAHALRLQGDLCALGKLSIQGSLFTKSFITPNKDDLVIVFSMSGRILGLNSTLMDRLKENNPYIVYIGQEQLAVTDEFLYIPSSVDETIKNLFLDYYLDEIDMKYMEKYYDY